MEVGKKVDRLPSCFGLNPAGLQYSTDNQFVQRLKELQDSAAVEKIPLIPSTPEEMSEMLQLCSYVRFKVPQQVQCSQQQYACPPPKAGTASAGLLTHPFPLVLLCVTIRWLSCAHDRSGTVFGPSGEERRQRGYLGRHRPVREAINKQICTHGDECYGGDEDGM